MMNGPLKMGFKDVIKITENAICGVKSFIRFKIEDKTTPLNSSFVSLVVVGISEVRDRKLVANTQRMKHKCFSERKKMGGFARDNDKCSPTPQFAFATSDFASGYCFVTLS
jgi:hypothetical protein